MDQLRAMRTFVSIVESGSLSEAARKLRLPLTTVSRLIAGLEDHLGATLLSRTTRRLSLTEAGRHYLDACRQALCILDDAESRLRGEKEEPSGELVISAPIVFGRVHVLPIIARFMAEYPKVSCRLLLSDKIVDLVEERADVAVRIGQLPDSALVASRVGSVRLLTCASPSYLRQREKIRTPQDLSEHNCIQFSKLGPRDRWIFKSKNNGRQSVRIRPHLEVTTAEAAIDAAAAGIGVARLLSYQVASAVKARTLRTVLDNYDDTPIAVHLVRTRQRLPKPVITALISFAAPMLRDVLRRID